MRFLNKLKSVRPVGEYRLRLVFHDGFVGEVDLAPLVTAPRGPLEEALQDRALFQQVTLDGPAPAWPNGYDLCPDVLRHWCELGSVCSQAELDAAFSREVAGHENMVLRDRPAP